MPVAYGKGPKGKATKLHSLIVRARGRCENCGDTTYGKLQCAHIIPRIHSATRTDEANAFCLCASCHFRFDRYADEWMQFIERTIGLDAYYRLKRKALVATKMDWKAEAVRLDVIWKQIKDEAA